MRNLNKTRCKRAILRVAFLLATCGKAGNRGAVVIAVTVEDFVFLAAIVFVRNLADHLKGFLVRLGTRVRIVDAVQTRHLFDQALCEFRTRNGPLSAGEVAHFHQLIADGISNFCTAIADVDGPYTARNSIKVLFARDVPNAHPFAFDDDLRIDRFKGFVLRKMVPHMRAVGFDDRSRIVMILRHGNLRRRDHKGSR